MQSSLKVFSIRYSKKTEIMEGVQSLDPKSPSFLKEEPLLALGKTFESDLETLSMSFIKRDGFF